MLAGTGRVTMGRETAMSARCLLAGDNAWITWTRHLNFYKVNVRRVWAVPLSANDASGLILSSCPSLLGK